MITLHYHNNNSLISKLCKLEQRSVLKKYKTKKTILLLKLQLL